MNNTSMFEKNNSSEPTIFLWDLDGIFNLMCVEHLSKEDQHVHFYNAVAEAASIHGLSISASLIEKLYIESRSTDKPYESATEVLSNSFGMPFHKVYHDVHDILIRDSIDLFKPNTELVNEFKKLKGLEHHIVTHSNESWTYYWLKETGIFDYFIESFHVKGKNMCKAHNENTYPYILSQIKAYGSQCIMIDDSERNLPLAEKAGIRPILFNEKPSVNGYETHSCPIALVESLKQAA